MIFLVLICKAIGTVCYRDIPTNVLSCIDAYGSMAAPYPSATTGIIPAASSVVTSDPSLVFNPETAWNQSFNVPSCSESGTMRVTSTINSSVSYVYTGKHCPNR